MVEFALILFPLLVFVGGIIQLGIGVSDWQNLNRIANEGARWAAINTWPKCAQSPALCNSDPTCDDSLVNLLRCEARNAGISPSSVLIEVCQPSGHSPQAGEPITVRLSVRTNFLTASKVTANGDQRLGNSGFVERFKVTIRGQATMRLEATPSATNPGTCA